MIFSLVSANWFRTVLHFSSMDDQKVDLYYTICLLPLTVQYNNLFFLVAVVYLSQQLELSFCCYLSVTVTVVYSFHVFFFSLFISFPTRGFETNLQACPWITSSILTTDLSGFSTMDLDWLSQKLSCCSYLILHSSLRRIWLHIHKFQGLSRCSDLMSHSSIYMSNLLQQHTKNLATSECWMLGALQRAGHWNLQLILIFQWE